MDSILYISCYININHQGDDTIYVNPPVGSPTHNINATSTSDAQLKADEDFARQLAQEEQIGKFIDASKLIVRD